MWLVTAPCSFLDRSYPWRCEFAQVSSLCLLQDHSWCLWNFVGIKWGSYFIDIAFLVAWLQLNQFFYNPLVVILGFIALDVLRVGCGFRSYYHFPHFVVWDVIPVFNSQYFLFQFPTLTRSCIDKMIASTICTPIQIVTIVNVVVRILLSTFATYLSTSTIILVMSAFLTIVAMQWIGYELLNSLPCVAYFYLLWYFGLVKCHYAGVTFQWVYPLFWL